MFRGRKRERIELFSVDVAGSLPSSANCDGSGCRSMARAFPLAFVLRADGPVSRRTVPSKTRPCELSEEGVSTEGSLPRILESEELVPATSMLGSISGVGCGFINSAIHLPSSMCPQRKLQRRRRVRSSSDILLPPRTRGSRQRAQTSVFTFSLDDDDPVNLPLGPGSSSTSITVTDGDGDSKL